MASRPSAIFRVEEQYGTYAAYCFDSAVIAWGTAFDGALDAATADAKSADAARSAQGRVLRRWLGAEVTGYRDPNQDRG